MTALWLMVAGPHSSGGALVGADLGMERFKAAGKPVYDSIQAIPPPTRSAAPGMPR